MPSAGTTQSFRGICRPFSRSVSAILPETAASAVKKPHPLYAADEVRHGPNDTLLILHGK